MSENADTTTTGDQASFNSPLNPFYYKNIRSFVNENGTTFKEVAIIERGEDVYFIIDQKNRVLLRSSPPDPDPTGKVREADSSKSSSTAARKTPAAKSHANRKGNQEIVIKREAAEQLTQILVDRFIVLFKQHIYSLLSEKEFGSLLEILNIEKNPQLLEICQKRGSDGLKSYLIRELFKTTTIRQRGFKILIFLTEFIASDDSGKTYPDPINEIENLTLDKQKQILGDFLAFIQRVGGHYDKKQIFDSVHQLFKEQEYHNLEHGGMGYFLEQFYYRELEDLKGGMIDDQNREFIEGQLQQARRDPLKSIKANVLSYLKAVAIVRMYKASTREERCNVDVDDNTPQRMIQDLLQFNLSVRTG